jgi:hypothetical protein
MSTRAVALIIAGLLATATVSFPAQAKPEIISTEQLPEVVLASARNLMGYGSISMVVRDKDSSGHTVYRIYAQRGGGQWVATFAPDGTLLERWFI